MHEIIGQHDLKAQLEQLKELPGLTILLGPKGSGRKTFIQYIAETRNYTYITVNNKIQDIRQMIEDTVALNDPTIYYIENADELTIQAANAMLKIAEEPPKNLHIMFGLASVENTLPTIISRARVFRMNNYTRRDLEEYYIHVGEMVLSCTHSEQLLNCSNNIGELITYVTIGFDRCYNYAELVYRNILEVNTGNAFKISSKLSFKDSDEVGIPVILFLNLLQEVLRTKVLTDDPMVINSMLRYIAQSKYEMARKGANKKLIFDILVLNIRTLR